MKEAQKNTIKFIETKRKKAKPDFNNLGFGKEFTDYMLCMNYKDGQWEEMVIRPYSKLAMDPCTTFLHYGQGIFEGMKAYKNAEGVIRMFRPEKNIERMNRSCERLCMPQLPTELVLEGIFKLVELEKDWIPTDTGKSLYVRPFMFAIDEALGVHAGKKYLFIVICSPVGSYYANGLKPTSIYVEDKYVRATIGGTGEAKCVGNYAASLLAGEEAQKKGYDQVLWLDGVERKYVEEVGAMNMFFVINGTVVTPILNGSILPGITRMSTIEVCKALDIKVEERRVSIDEVVGAYKNGTLTEAFGTGTAAVISPVGRICYKGEDMIINNQEMGEITGKLYDELTGIQYGLKDDKLGWVKILNK